ncbi:hypothetical protein Q8F55_003489 [Vanrija albida]|uniref:Uncharacterized protein n=1 Tax=Vanrija albida TaxID=181172 RepID=A0ABR3Q4C9_9TREE
MSTRDYTDSESDGETRGRELTSAHSTPARGSPTRSSPTKAGGPSNPSLRITLRPNMSHLVDESPSTSSKKHPRERSRDRSDADHYDRSSASPPPHQIRLKLGSSSGKQSMASKAAYSSSEGESDAPERKKDDRSPPTKKQRTSKGANKQPKPAGPTLPAQHRKTYDWLQPSSASASHHGPPDREGREPRDPPKPEPAKVTPKAKKPREKKKKEEAVAEKVETDVDDDVRSLLGEEFDSLQGSVPPEGKSKKAIAAAARRKAAAASGEAGPGRNWRKGLKKGDPLPWKEATFLGDGHKVMKSSPLATPQRPAASTEGTPEPLDATVLAAAMRPRDAREPSPPFVLANAAELGFPVFSKPISAPKINLSPFPKITQSFAPFDNKPFRPEKVRSWAVADRSVVTIGGGTLKFKTWTRGPQSALGVVLEAQREADAAAKAAKRAAKEANNSGQESTPGPSSAPERPPLLHSPSADSVLPVDGEADDGASEMGGDDESVAGSVRDSPAPSPAPIRGRGAASKRGRPRKSKLAQEIIPTDQSDGEGGEGGEGGEAIKTEEA